MWNSEKWVFIRFYSYLFFTLEIYCGIALHFHTLQRFYRLKMLLALNFNHNCVCVYIYIYINEGHSKSFKPHLKRRTIDEHFCRGNILWLLIKLEKIIQISVLVSVYLFGFYGISVLVGYLIPNLFYTWILNIWFVNTFCW